ncbi:LamG-like jellyroll fold domain-containing protein [Dapis sp. BLCC M229]|uniref:LamG domain-containing protein n=1 Tax=Dapis sp. BLCC M229 TaxID=3400188 RepID=UPI003CED8EF0
MPTVKKGTRTEDKPENLNLDEIDEFLSTTARLTADAPFQVLSDDQYIYIFRQSIAGNDPNIVYKLTRLEGGGSSGDTTRDNSEFVLSGGNKVPLVNNTLLLDRFILLGAQLQPKMEVRYKRSRNKTQPANSKDSLGAKDMEGKAFSEPTQELDFVRQLEGGRFQVLLLPTQIANINRWQVFAYNSATSKIDSFNIERATDGLFNTKGTIHYTSPDPEYQSAIFQRRPGVDSFTNQELVPILSAQGGAESALSFNGTDNYVDLGNPSELQITGSQTIEMWVKPLSLANRQSLFCKAYNGEGAITLEVDGKLSYYYGTGGNNPSETNIDYDAFEGILSTFGLLRDEWSHIAIVRNFESRTLTCYIDGAFAGEEILTKDAATAGSDNVFLAKGYADNFNGCIDEVRIWNRARTGYEINEDRHHRLVGREAGLVGYWRFDENTGATVYDQTDSANNGTIYGATWQESDALIGNHPGVSRDSFSITGRTIESGLTAVQYFQQEDAQIGNDQESKPMKTNARVMLAVATGGTDANGATTTNKYIATLDFAVSREGKLTQVPDNLSLNWLNRTDLDGDSIESSFAAVGSLEAEVIQLKREIQGLTEELQPLEEITQGLEELNQKKQDEESQLKFWKEKSEDQEYTYIQIEAHIKGYERRIDDVNTRITKLETQKASFDSKIAELTQKQASLITKQEELERKKETLYGQVSLPMALLHTDSDGLTASGALLGFANTQDTPQLLDSAMGKLALYFQGTNTQFFTAYYDTKTARAQKVIDTDGGKVRFLARSTGAESNAANITISDGNSDDTCEVTIANSQTGMIETWENVPRDPRMFSKVLNGQAKPLYLAQVSATSGTVTELTLVETTNRQLAAGAVLKIGETKVTTSADVPVNSSSIPVNSVSLEVEEETPVYLVLYDYAANDTLASAALEFDGSNDCVELGDFNPGNTFTIEFWVKLNTSESYTDKQYFITKYPYLSLSSNQEGSFLLQLNNSFLSFHSFHTITLGEWFHVALVVKENYQYEFYQDGLLIRESNYSENSFDQKEQPWFLGALVRRSSDNKSGLFSGQMDEVRIWNYARTKEEINIDKDHRLTGTEPGLLGYWHFEGSTANDYSGNGNNGTIYGNPKNVPSPPLRSNSDLQLENGSRQFLVYSEATAGTIPNGTVTSLGDAPSCRWVADAPGLALDFDGQSQYLAIGEDEIPRMDATANLTLEAWVKPKVVSTVGRIIVYNDRSKNSQYTLGLQEQGLMSALELDGDYIQLPPESIPSGKEITFSLWAYGDSTLPLSTSLIEAYNEQDERIFNVHLPWSNRHIFFDCGGDRINRHAERQYTDPTDFVEAEYKGKWSHWAFTKNADTGEMKIYYNGKLWHWNDDNSKTGILPKVKAVRLGSGVNGDNYYYGKIDEVQIWNYARSEEQIQADMNRRLSGNESGLVGYWHFEGGTAKDYSGNGNDGTIYGNPTNVASALSTYYKVFAGVGVGDSLAEANRYLKTKDVFPLDNWNHLAVSYNQSYALNFNGNDYLDCGKNRALNLCEDLTIETVIQIGDSKLRSIISKGLMGSGVEKESVPYGLQVEAGKLIFSFEDSQGTIHKLESPAYKIQTNTVHKIAVTRQKVTQTTESGADPDAWGTGDVADIDAKTGDFSSSENQKIDKAMKADYVASKKRGKKLKQGLREQDTASTSQEPTFITGQGIAQWLELKMYIDGLLVCSRVIEPAVSSEGNNQPLEIGRTGESYFLGKISEVKLWSRALEKGEIHQKLTGQEKGLVAWWQLEENEGNLANDFKGGNHAQIKGATWCKNPDVEASEFLLYSNGVLLGTESLPSDEPMVFPNSSQFTLGARKGSGGPSDYDQCFNGIMEEVRVWKVVRTQEQILDNLFTRLKGEKQDLIANYTFDEIFDNELKDKSLMGNHLMLRAEASKPTSVFSDAPISNDIPQVRSALAAVETVFNAQIDSSPAVTEYGDMQYDSQQNLTGVFKRCYTYIKDGKWRLITGYKVGNLITEWVSQVQFDPQIIGYIEGAPPIPGENMTVGPVSLADTDTYKQAGTVELIEAEEVNYNFSSSKENGFDSSFEAAMSAGVELDLRTLLAPLGFGVSFKAQVAFNVSSSGKFQSSGGWTDEKTISSGRTVTRNMRATAVGYWEDKNNLLNPRLGQRYVMNNQGFALVQSETADVFALRLAHNKALISYRFQPNPDIPKDWNIISFPINPRYTKQGTLDGKVGYQPDGSVQTDPDYPQATQYGEYSYFKPIETYALKREIEREAAELKNYYQNYDASPLSNSILKNVMSTNAGLLASAAGAIPIGGIGLGAATTFGSLADALTKDESLPEKFATRNIANTYVWTADGGFYAETTNTMDVRQESSSGSYSFNTNFGTGISLNVAVIGTFGFNLNGSMGGHLNMTQSKSAETSQSFRVEVQVNPQNNLYKYEVPEDQKDWESTYVDYLLQYDTEGNPIKVPGKVDAYRFMTFYLEPKAENFEDFYAKVVDPIWIEQSDDPNAQALREARQSDKKPACWRIMHRVTFVSRLLQDFNDDAASQLAKDARALNIDSNWQLIKTLEPFVKNKTDNFVQFADAVRDALEEYLPELQPHSPEIIAYMAQYYGLSEDA